MKHFTIILGLLLTSASTAMSQNLTTDSTFKPTNEIHIQKQFLNTDSGVGLFFHRNVTPNKSFRLGVTLNNYSDGYPSYYRRDTLSSNFYDRTYLALSFGQQFSKPFL